jgi:hypothetical protein
MLFTPGRRKQRVELAAILLTAVFMLLPATASAHRRAHLQSQVNEEAATGSLEEPTTPSTEADPESEGSSTTPEAPAETGASGRRTRREERRARRAARADARAGSGCTVQLRPQAVTAEAAATLVGAVTCPQPAEPAQQTVTPEPAQQTVTPEPAQQTVTLYQKLAGTPGFTAVATTSPESDGQFQFATDGLGLDSIFYVRIAGAKSARVRVQLAPVVTIASPVAGTPLFTAAGARSASAGTLSSSAVSFTGTVSPTDAGATVILERGFKDGGWVSIGSGHVDEEGDYSIPYTFSKAGQTRVRVLVRPHSIYMKGVSAPVTYVVSSRRRDGVTIEPSADPLAYGATLTLSGTIPGAEDQKVTLFAQTGAGAFAPVAQTVALGNAYSFSQVPLQSTRYRVASSAASSPVLAETVTYALAPAPAPASVTVGEALTFTGGVLPAHEGQQVDLERESLSGRGGYHVIASTTTSSSGTYSLTYTFAAIGNATLRISAPGNTEVATADGEPFELAIEPAS